MVFLMKNTVASIILLNIRILDKIKIVNLYNIDNLIPKYNLKSLAYTFSLILCISLQR